MPTRSISPILQRMLIQADEDLAVAKLIALHSPYRESVRFHCQQAAERYLKALFIISEDMYLFNDLPLDITHSLRTLLELLPDEIVQPEGMKEKAILLQTYSRASGVDAPSNEQSVTISEEICNWVKSELKKLN